MKKFRMFVLFAMLVLLLAGCGQTQAEKITEVQHANAITTADVVELLEYRDLTVEQQTPSDAWMEQWPDVEIYKINGEGLLLMQATDGLHLYQRDKLVQELEWRGGYFVLGVEETTLLDQLMKDFVPETGFYAQNMSLEAKNIIACYVPYYDSAHPEELDWENEEVRLTWQAVAEDVGVLRDEIKAAFYEDINGMEVKTSNAKGKQFDLDVMISYYQVPFEMDGNTTYDLYYEMETYITNHEETAEKFRGQEAKVELKYVKAGIGATRNINTSGTFEELFEKITDVTDLIGDTELKIDDRFIVGPNPQEMLEFQVVVTVGDYVETFDVTLNLRDGMIGVRSEQP